mgnify:CR=1 FL=1
MKRIVSLAALLLLTACSSDDAAPVRAAASGLRGKADTAMQMYSDLLVRGTLEPAQVSFGKYANVRSAIDADAMRRALQALTERHAALRTVFVERDGEPVAVVRDRVEVAFEVLEAGAGGALAHGVEEGGVEAELLRLAQREPLVVVHVHRGVRTTGRTRRSREVRNRSRPRRSIRWTRWCCRTVR